jgi:hypothetical protein
MVLSKPKEYVSILIAEIKLIIQGALINYYEETFHAKCTLHESRSRLDLEMEKVDKLRDEIIHICENLQNKGDKL